MNTPNFLLIQLGFGLLTFVFMFLLLREVRQALDRTTLTPERRRKIFSSTIISIALWLCFTGILSSIGFFNDFSLPPRIAIVVVVPLIVVIWLLCNDTATQVIQAMSLRKLLSLQVFRVFVEILLWALFAESLLPEQMTFEGRNFDVLSGLTGPVIAWLVYREKISRTLIIIWNLLCLGLLINIVATAILSMPTPFRVFMNDPANTIVATFPIIWLPGFLVPLAYTLHLFALKRLKAPL